MRGRFQQVATAVQFSLSAMAVVLVLTFFFYDGPIHVGHLEAAAQANEALPLPTIEPRPETASAANTPGLESAWHAMNFRFPVHWRQVSLDHRQVQLNVLKSPFVLAQTTDKTGSESFEYASYLFGQVAQNLQHSPLQQEFLALSAQAQTLGNTLRQASHLRYDGAPTEDMTHLQVRSAILFHLQELNAHPLVLAQYNQHGDLLTENGAQPAFQSQPGEEVQLLSHRVQAILNHPLAAQYPQTMQLVRAESELLQRLAEHLTLRWESTLYCQKSCDTMATYVRVYTRQTLPAQTPGAITLM